MAHSSRILVGRDPELASLISLLGVTSAPGAGSAAGHVLLSGDAGVGKTRLLTELGLRAETVGWQVYVGHCLDFGDSAIAYLPLSEVLDRMADALPDVVDDAVRAYPALARLQPVRRRLGREGGDRPDATGVDRADLFDGVQALLESAASKSPVLLVVEDTHWADQSTRDLLTFLFTRTFSEPVSVVVSYRSDDLHRRHPLRRPVAEWTRLPGVERLALSPLSDDAVRSLIAELAGDIPEHEREAIVARAEGNAFFVEELVGAAHGDEVPEDLADLLLVRLDRLDEETREVVRTAAVSGRRVSHELLEAVTGLDQATLDDALRRAVEMNILVAAEGRYAFRHALLGEAVYDDLLPGERVRLHARYAAALQEVSGRGTAAELAWHARRSHDLAVALTASIQAGDEAMGVGGPDEAADHYQVALSLAADPAIRTQIPVDLPRLAVKAADALTIAGYPARAAALIAEQLDQLADDVPASSRARMLMSRAEALFVMESGTESLDLSAEAAALVPEDAPVTRAKVLASRARILSAYGRLEEAQAVGMDALALAERHDLHHVAAEAVTTLSGLRKRGPKEALRAALRDAIAQAEATRSIHAELAGRFFLGRSYEDWAEFDDAQYWFASAMERADHAGIPWAPYAGDARWHLVWAHFLRGHWDEAMRLATVQRAPATVRGVLDTVRLAIRQARGADVRREARALRRLWAEEGLIAIHSAPLETADAIRRSDPRGVLAAYDDVVDALMRIWHPWFSARIRLGALTIGGLADLLPGVPAAERDSLVARAEEIHAEGHTVMAQLSEPSGEWGPEGRAWLQRLDAEWARLRWLTGVDAPSQDDLVVVWRDCEAAFAELGHVYELARTRIALATILRATGDLAGSRAVTGAARETARALGAQPLLDQLRALGSTPLRAAPSEPAALTPREREILGLVAAGRTNGEIGRQLFISTKTVSVHVSNILGKLGAAGRTEAAAIARRRGLVDTG